MATLSFDTLKFSKRLQEAGVSQAQADAEAEALADALSLNLQEVATKQDLVLLEQRITIKLGGLMVIAVGAVATLVKLI